MALFNDKNYFRYSNGPAFDVLHEPGDETPYSGIYRCEACGDEIASNKGNPLPPQNHNQHPPSQGRIRWRLIAAAEQR